MAIRIITGHSGTQHVLPKRQKILNAARVGPSKYVYNVGLKFAYEIISNNLIRVKNGKAINQGVEYGIDVDDYEELTIENGLAGVKRNDLIVASYNLDAANDSIETITFKVIKGTSATTPVDPAYTSGDLVNGATADDMLLYRVVLNGLSIESVTPLFDTVASVKAMFDSLAPEYTKTTFAYGAYCYRYGTLYKCTLTGGITTAEDFTAGHWTATTAAAEFLSLNTNLATTNSNLVKTYYGTLTTPSFGAGATSDFTITLPSGYTTILAIIPIGIIPGSTYATMLYVRGITLPNKITAQAYGASPVSQTYTIQYLVLYK